jgi:hypothetical protein
VPRLAEIPIPGNHALPKCCALFGCVSRKAAINPVYARVFEKFGAQYSRTDYLRATIIHIALRTSASGLFAHSVLNFYLLQAVVYLNYWQLVS